jgi:NTP pyrophosphatase (non-canonical NTP hydrolase)
MSENFVPLTIDQYAKEAALTDQRKGKNALSFSMLGVFGETGSLLSEVKKKQRDKASYLGYAQAVSEELGDVLWYLASIARRSGIPLSTIAANALDTKNAAHPANSNLNFHSLQPAHMPMTGEPSAQFEHKLLALAGQIGLLVNDYQSGSLAAQNSMLESLTC